jgi:hypothetical protein
MNLLTPAEIFYKKPSVQNFFSAQQLGILLSLGIIRGKKTSRTCYVALEDVAHQVELKKVIISERIEASKKMLKGK